MVLAPADELQPVMVIRQSVVLLGARVVVVHLAFMVACLLYIAAFESRTTDFKLMGLMWFGLVEVVVMFYAILRWHNHYYLVRPDKIFSSRGVFLRRQRFCAIKNIETISVNQGLLGKVFNFGTLHLFAPTLNHRIHMFGIGNPCKKERIIEKLLPNTLEFEGGRRKRDLLIVPGRKA